MLQFAFSPRIFIGHLYLFFLTFREPCIVMYSYNESQRDALFLKFI